MCGRFYVPEDASIQMIRAIVERLEHRNVKVKTGDVFPGDMAAVVASNRQLQPQPFAMEWGYGHSGLMGNIKKHLPFDRCSW